MDMSQWSSPIVVETRIHRLPTGKIRYPYFSAGAPTHILATLNRTVITEINQLIQKQQPETGNITEMLGDFEIKTNERDILSLTLSYYTFVEHSAHGMTYIRSLSFNTQHGKLYTLNDMFKPNAPYQERLTQLIQIQIDARKIPTLGDFTLLSPDQDFYIADKCLVVFFQLYEISPYYVGFPMFPISVFEIQDIITEQGPLGRMAKNN